MNSQDIFLLKISEAQPGDILVIRSDYIDPAVAYAKKIEAQITPTMRKNIKAKYG